jgi:hypothetical protein
MQSPQQPKPLSPDGVSTDPEWRSKKRKRVPKSWPVHVVDLNALLTRP